MIPWSGNRAASVARRQFENEMAAMAGRLRKRNDDKFAQKAAEKAVSLVQPYIGV